MPLHLLGISRSNDASRQVPSPDSGERARPASSVSGGGQGGRVAGLSDSIDVRWVVQGPLAAATIGPSSRWFGPFEHARLLAAIHARQTVLPARYGMELPDEEAVRAFLSNRSENLLSDLDRVEGANEIGLRIELDCNPVTKPPASSDSAGSDVSPARYLALRLARYQRQDRASAQAQLAVANLLRALEGLYRSWRQLLPEAFGTVRLAFLVDRQRSEAFVNRLESWKSDQPARRCTVLGPWPPYSFVGVATTSRSFPPL